MKEREGQGRIRVLENAVRRIVVQKRQGCVTLKNLRNAGIVPPTASDGVAAGNPISRDWAAGKLSVEVGGMPLKEIVRRVERDVLEELLRRHDGNGAAARRELQVSKDIWYRIRGTWGGLP